MNDHTDHDIQRRYRPTRVEFMLGPRLFADELHRLRKLADEALDSIDPAFAGCYGTAPAYMTGASDAPDRETASVRGEVGRGTAIASQPSTLPAYVRTLIERLVSQ